MIRKNRLESVINKALCSFIPRYIAYPNKTVSEKEMTSDNILYFKVDLDFLFIKSISRFTTINGGKVMM